MIWLYHGHLPGRDLRGHILCYHIYGPFNYHYLGSAGYRPHYELRAPHGRDGSGRFDLKAGSRVEQPPNTIVRLANPLVDDDDLATAISSREQLGEGYLSFGFQAGRAAVKEGQSGG